MDLPACSPLRLAAALRSVAIAALALAVLVPGAALAQAPAGTGGAAPAQAARCPPPPRLRPPRRAPVVDAITCRTACLGISRATPGSVVRISGEGMATVASVILLGRRGYRDDVTVTGHAGVAHGGRGHAAGQRARRPGARHLRHRASARCSRKMRLVVRPAGTRDPGGPVVEAKVQTRKLLFEGGRKATVSFYVRGVAPVDVAVDVVRASDRVAVAHFAVPAVGPRQRAERRLGRDDRRRRAARRPLRLPGRRRDRGRRRARARRR